MVCSPFFVSVTILEEEILAVPNNTEKLKTRQTVLTHTVLVKSIFGCYAVLVDDENRLKIKLNLFTCATYDGDGQNTDPQSMDYPKMDYP